MHERAVGHARSVLTMRLLPRHERASQCGPAVPAHRLPRGVYINRDVKWDGPDGRLVDVETLVAEICARAKLAPSEPEVTEAEVRSRIVRFDLPPLVPSSYR
jgi:hypothetical protein